MTLQPRRAEHLRCFPRLDFARSSCSCAAALRARSAALRLLAWQARLCCPAASCGYVRSTTGCSLIYACGLAVAEATKACAERAGPPPYARPLAVSPPSPRTCARRLAVQEVPLVRASSSLTWRVRSSGQSSQARVPFVPGFDTASSPPLQTRQRTRRDGLLQPLLR